MRYSRMREHTERREEKTANRSGSIVLILIIAAAAAYIIFATKVGDHLADKIVAPVVSYFTGKNTEEFPAESAMNPTTLSVDMISAELNFPAIEQYLLQYGVFGSKENAQNAANELKKIGGAGYIYDEDGKYRVIISGYSSKADAENVKDRLQSDRGMESKVLDITASELNCSIACEAEYAEQLKSAASDIAAMHGDMLNTILSLDGGSITQEDAIGKFNEKKELIGKHTVSVNMISEKTDDALVKAIALYCNTVQNGFNELSDSISGAELSSAMKRIYIGTAYAYRDLLQYDIND